MKATYDPKTDTLSLELKSGPWRRAMRISPA